MTRSVPPRGPGEIDWSRPWLAPWRTSGEPLAAQALRVGLVEALNARVTDAMRLRAGRLRFVEQAVLPAAEPYEAYIDRTACVPVRDNLHDFYNGPVWLVYPALKRRLNELQAAQLTVAERGAPRGAVRDVLTLFDENAALLQAPTVLVEALRRRDWQRLFVTERAAWAQARLTLIGHALLEKLERPRKAITAHVWVVAPSQSGAECVVDALTGSLSPQSLATKPYLPLPVLGECRGGGPGTRRRRSTVTRRCFARPKRKQRPKGRCLDRTLHPALAQCRNVVLTSSERPGLRRPW